MDTSLHEYKPVSTSVPITSPPYRGSRSSYRALPVASHVLKETLFRNRWSRDCVSGVKVALSAVAGPKMIRNVRTMANKSRIANMKKRTFAFGCLGRVG
jgi:hypothetical protein